MSTIKQVLKEQEDFLKQVLLTLVFLRAYANNPTSFEVLLSDEIKEVYEYDRFKSNVEHLWETFDAITCDIVHGKSKFTIKTRNALPCLDYAAKKKKKATAEEIIEAFDSFAAGPWSITTYQA